MHAYIRLHRIQNGKTVTELEGGVGKIQKRPLFRVRNKASGPVS